MVLKNECLLIVRTEQSAKNKGFEKNIWNIPSKMLVKVAFADTELAL